MRSKAPPTPASDNRTRVIWNITPALLTTKEAAQLCNVGERTLWRWSRCGIAPKPVKFRGGTVRYRRDEYLQWIADGCPRIDGERAHE